MDPVQKLLFGGFPRAVGVTSPDSEGMELQQYLVHSETEFNGVLDKVADRRNVYASISRYEPAKKADKFSGCAVEADKVSFDLDSSAKSGPNSSTKWSHPEIPDNLPDNHVFTRMENNSAIREVVLGDVCRDVQKIAERCQSESVPLMGVFSGFGIHCHLLHKPTASHPGEKMQSMCRQWSEEENLETVDSKASGKPYRIMRVPNLQRVDHHGGSTVRTGHYTVPLSRSDLAEITPEGLMVASTEPEPNIDVGTDTRPEMKIREEYQGPQRSVDVDQDDMRPVPTETLADEFVQFLVKQITKMPCVWERALGRNPANDVRIKLGIMFLNAGFIPETITNIISRIGWVDFDRETTQYQLEKLYESGKGDFSCKTMKQRGLCVRADDEANCEIEGYRGGNRPVRF